MYVRVRMYVCVRTCGHFHACADLREMSLRALYDRLPEEIQRKCDLDLKSYGINSHLDGYRSKAAGNKMKCLLRIIAGDGTVVEEQEPLLKDVQFAIGTYKSAYSSNTENHARARRRDCHVRSPYLEELDLIAERNARRKSGEPIEPAPLCYGLKGFTFRISMEGKPFVDVSAGLTLVPVNIYATETEITALFEGVAGVVDYTERCHALNNTILDDAKGRWAQKFMLEAIGDWEWSARRTKPIPAYPEDIQSYVTALDELVVKLD